MEGTNLEVGPPSLWLGFRPQCRRCGGGPPHGGEVLGWAHPELVPSHGASRQHPTCVQETKAGSQALRWEPQWEPDHGSTSEI